MGPCKSAVPPRRLEQQVPHSAAGAGSSRSQGGRRGNTLVRMRDVFSALGDPHVIRRISVRAAWNRSVIQVIRRSQRVNRRSTLSLTRKLIIEINWLAPFAAEQAAPALPLLAERPLWSLRGRPLCLVSLMVRAAARL